MIFASDFYTRLLSLRINGVQSYKAAHAYGPTPKRYPGRTTRRTTSIASPVIRLNARRMYRWIG